MDTSTEAVARELLDVVPVIMRTIRTEMRSPPGERSDRAIVPYPMFIERHPGVSLQELAGHLGLTSPSVCKIVDGLVAHATGEAPAFQHRSQENHPGADARRTESAG